VTRVLVERAGRLDVVIADLVPELTRSRAGQLVRAGHVRVEGVAERRAGRRVGRGVEVEVEVPEAVPVAVRAQDLPLTLVFEDAHIAVIDKAPGMVVHPGPGHADGTLVNALLHHLSDLSGIGGELRPGIVHRLDRGTSGLLVVAKTDVAHHGLAAQFAAHSAGRRYLAIVAGAPSEDAGRVESLLGRHPNDRVRHASGARGRRAVSHWRVRQRGEGVALLEVQLETGRTHQVRVHLSEQGWPILGDPLYNRRRRGPREVRPLLLRPMLHAWRLQLVHPTSGEALRFDAVPPPDFDAVQRALGLSYNSAHAW